MRYHFVLVCFFCQAFWSVGATTLTATPPVQYTQIFTVKSPAGLRRYDGRLRDYNVNISQDTMADPTSRRRCSFSPTEARSEIPMVVLIIAGTVARLPSNSTPS